jgi:hypothetical protein
MYRLLILALFCLSCASNKTAKEEFNETANQVDNGVRRVIKEVKETAGKAVKKLEDKE